MGGPPFHKVYYEGGLAIRQDIILFRPESLLDASCFADDDERQKLSIYPCQRRFKKAEKRRLKFVVL